MRHLFLILWLACPAWVFTAPTIILNPMMSQVRFSGLLSEYYSRSSVMMPGAEVQFVTAWNGLGVYGRYHHFSIEVPDKNHRHLRESSSWFGFGIVKAWKIRNLDLFAKAGLTLHRDDLLLPSANESRWGGEFGLGLHLRCYRNCLFAMDVVYNNEEAQVADYRTMVYSRHACYLSGKSFNTGGFVFSLGLALSFGAF